MSRRLLIVLTLFCASLAVLTIPVSAVESPGILTNGGFETELETSGWTLTLAAGDKRICESTEPVPVAGSCMFRFKGGPGKTVLKQTISDAGLQIINNASACGLGFLQPSLYFYSNIGQADIPTIQLMVKFSVNNSDFKLKLNDRVSSFQVAAWNQQVQQQLFIPSGATMQKVTFAIRHDADSGKMFVDQAQLVFNPVGARAC